MDAHPSRNLISQVHIVCVHIHVAACVTGAVYVYECLMHIHVCVHVYAYNYAITHMIVIVCACRHIHVCLHLCVTRLFYTLPASI